MGSSRKLKKAEDDIADLEARLRVVSEHAWTMQLVAACLLERFALPNGTCILDFDLRTRAIDEEWGVRTEVLPDETQPMAVILQKPLAERAALDGAKKVIVPGPKRVRRGR